MAASVLIVDDEPDLLDLLSIQLKRAGLNSARATSGAEALRYLIEKVPDLVLLDIMLPDLVGTEVFRLMRHDPRLASVPVIFLTARGEDADRIKGLELGADDYIVKTASMREIILRIHAVLRRGTEKNDATRRVTFGVLAFDEAAHRAWVEGHEVVLTALEFRLLRTLHERRGRVQSRERLLEDVWSVSSEITTRTVDTHIKRLREKLGDPGGVYVETVRGVGYRFAEQPPE